MVKSTDRPDMTIAVAWDVKNQTKQTNKQKTTGQLPVFLDIEPVLSSGKSVLLKDTRQ